uniref:cDNA FLJ51508 n=1 Tax=Homo sapiens TaxID=9606 RepID=B4DP90_HUMAN|nr:unnamed protein product [Homo sapiens]
MAWISRLREHLGATAESQVCAYPQAVPQGLRKGAAPAAPPVKDPPAPGPKLGQLPGAEGQAEPGCPSTSATPAAAAAMTAQIVWYRRVSDMTSASSARMMGVAGASAPWRRFARTASSWSTWERSLPQRRQSGGARSTTVRAPPTSLTWTTWRTCTPWMPPTMATSPTLSTTVVTPTCRCTTSS